MMVLIFFLSLLSGRYVVVSDNQPIPQLHHGAILIEYGPDLDKAECDDRGALTWAFDNVTFCMNGDF